MILNGLQFDDFGGHSPRRRPFPGSNLFSLASGGAMKPAEAVKIIADDDVNLGMISSFGGKKRKKGAA